MILQEQYAMVQYSRELLLSFVETIDHDLYTPVPACDNRSVRDLLEHSASSYFYWVSYFALRQPERSLMEEGFTTMPLIRELYRQVDETMDAFLEKFSNNPDAPITDVPEDWGPGTATPLQVFTQVVTHECHHKGQIVLMCRLLGHIPPDTDVRRSFPNEV